jgi:hypothetical protein
MFVLEIVLWLALFQPQFHLPPPGVQVGPHMRCFHPEKHSLKLVCRAD